MSSLDKILPGASTTSAFSGTAAGITSTSTPLRLGVVALTVRDLDSVKTFYERVIGLSAVDAGAGFARLGVGETVLIELRSDPHAEIASPRSAGLFHTAFLLPSRADLARWLLHAAETGVRLQGASDHLVSEAIYLADPEGNGIEVYRDRPSEEWTRNDGAIQMATLRLDLDDLVASAPSKEWSGVPHGSCIGHVHLQVGDLEQAEAFYAGRLGFDVECRYPGATFFGSGGYHHHVGTNIWNSAGAPERPAGTTGLASVEIVPADREVFTALVGRLQLAAPPTAEKGSGGEKPLSLRDPWGTTILIRPV